MPILNVETDALPTPIAGDICIVGSGPAGLTLASSLAASGLRVLVLESGGVEPCPEIQGLSLIENGGQAVRHDFMSRVRLLGGTSNLWPGRCMALRPFDLTAREWVPASGWPIGYDELARFYGEAADILRLPRPQNRRDAGYLREPALDEKRLLDDDELVPDWALWAKSPLRFGKAFQHLFRGSRDLVLLLRLTALELLVDESGRRVTGVRAVRIDGRTSEIAARYFVLATGGLENARLLLLSRQRHPFGLGNDHDQVGRHFMDHPRAVMGRLRLHRDCDLGLLLGRPTADGRVKTGIALAEGVQRRERLLGAYLELEPAYSPGSARLYGSAQEVVRWVYRRRFGHCPEDRVAWREAGRYIYKLTLREVLPHRLYHGLQWLMKRRARELVTVVHCEQAPDPASRVCLGHAHDRLGQRRLRLDWRLGEGERRSAARLLEGLDRAVRRVGLGVVTAEGSETLFGDASHHMGTTRMGRDPHHSVVDPNGRVHGVDNLFVAGSSVFPTGGYCNPTLTIVALSLRLGAHLAALCRTAP